MSCPAALLLHGTALLLHGAEVVKRQTRKRIKLPYVFPVSSMNISSLSLVVLQLDKLSLLAVVLQLHRLLLFVLQLQ